MEEPLIFTQQTVSIQVCAFLMLEDWCAVLHNVLFLTSGNFQPQSIVKSLVPSMNTLVLFEVSPVSFHQVGCCYCCFPHRLWAFCTLVTRLCASSGCRGFDKGQVSPVFERLVPRPLPGAPPSPRRGPRSTEPAFTERCKFDTREGVL